MGSTGDQVYDYIVCGGGTTGCVVAGRLAEDPNVSILVLEAGPDSKDLENVHMVGGWSQNFDKETDWNVISDPGEGIDGRQVKLSRGKFLGGSSGCNGTLCIRGSRQDYDDWGVEGWGGEEFFKYMKKAEKFKSKSWFKEDKDSHGYNGELGIEPHDPAPITGRILTSMQDKGLALDPDMFSHGRNPHGCGHAPRTVTDGLRTTGADFVSKQNARDNITIITNCHVDKVVLTKSDQGELQASAVSAVMQDGSTLVAQARREVVISGGAYCSPNILNRSGIGAKNDLAKHGIETLVDLPGVGQNLMDHLIVFIFYETEQEGLTTDHLVYHGDAFNKTYQLWKDTKSGFLSSFPFGAFAFARLDDRLADSEVWNSAPREPGRDPMGLTPSQPNIEFFTTECYGGPKQYDQFPVPNKHAFSIIAELFRPKSRGTVTLRDKDARSVPIVDCRYLTDPLDVEVLAEACRFGNEIILEGRGTADLVKGAWPPTETHGSFKTREDWIPFVKKHATTCYHASGTCKMGTDSDPNAVVDGSLRVKGVKGLRVADVSIMPILHGGHTQMPAYGIGEKAAEMIKQAWK